MKIKNLKFKIITILLCAICYTLYTRQALAQDASLGIYPPIMQVDTIAPANPKADIFLENSTDKSVDINILYKPFASSQKKDGQIQILDSFSTFPDPLFANRIKILDQDIPVKSLTLAPKQGKKLTLELDIPAGQEKGDYYFTILFVQSPNLSTLANSSAQSAGVGMNVLLSIGPKGTTSGYVKEFSTPFFVDNGPVSFKIDLANTSNHFITPTGNITIKNMFGQTIGKVNLLSVNILSNSDRLIPDSLQANINAKNYENIKTALDKSISPVAIWPEIFLLGPYTATLNINLKDNTNSLRKSITFFAFPTTYLLAIIIILAITIFVILRVKKRIS